MTCIQTSPNIHTYYKESLGQSSDNNPYTSISYVIYDCTDNEVEEIIEQDLKNEEDKLKKNVNNGEDYGYRKVVYCENDATEATKYKFRSVSKPEYKNEELGKLINEIGSKLYEINGQYSFRLDPQHGDSPYVTIQFDDQVVENISNLGATFEYGWSTFDDYFDSLIDSLREAQVSYYDAGKQVNTYLKDIYDPVKVGLEVLEVARSGLKGELDGTYSLDDMKGGISAISDTIDYTIHFPNNNVQNIIMDIVANLDRISDNVLDEYDFQYMIDSYQTDSIA